MRQTRMFWLGITAVTVLSGIGSFAYATPSTEYWTPCVMDIQPAGKLHIGYDSYTTVGKRHQEKGSFPNDYQLEYGLQPFDKLQMEFGVDLMEPQDDPLLFNAKIGTPENSLFQNSPGLALGVFNVGTKHNVTDYNIADIRNNAG